MLFIFVSCERQDYSDAIYDTYREAERLSTSGTLIYGNMWSARSQEILNWDDAVSYCKDLTELGHYDWRLPTINELRTLMRNCLNTEPGGLCNLTDECLEEEISEDCTSYHTECDNNHCSCQYNNEEGYYSKLGDSDTYWSSTEAGCSNYAFVVYFRTAHIDTESKAWSVYVRCVR